MYWPPPWHNAMYSGAHIDGATDQWAPEQWAFVPFPQPEEGPCVVGENGVYRCSKTSRKGGWYDFNTNGTYIPEDQESTLPKTMSANSNGPNGYDYLMEKRHPWAAPGTADIYGGGCGVNGGNPNGCWKEDPYSYGHCCTKNVCII